MNRIARTSLLVVCAFGLFTAARLYLLVSSPAAFEGLDARAIAGAFWRGLRFDGWAIAVVLGPAFLLMNLPLGIARGSRWFRAWAWVGCAVGIVMVAMLVADVAYFSTLGRHMGDDLAAVGEETDAAQIARHLVEAAVAASMVTALVLVWRRVLRASEGLDEPTRPATFAAVVIWLGIGIHGGLPGRGLPEVSDAYADASFEAGNLSLNGIFATGRSLLDRGAIERKPSDVSAEAAAAAGARFHRVGDGEARVTNLVIVVLESWGGAYVDAVRGEGMGLTPEFDALSRDGLIYRRFYAVGDESMAALQATLTGVPRLPGLVRIDRGMLDEVAVTEFATVATAHGFETLVVNPSKRPSNTARVQTVTRALGFEKQVQDADIPAREQRTVEVYSDYGWDHDTFQHALAEIGTLEPPFLALVLSGTSHDPFPDPGNPYREPDAAIERSMAAFRATLRYSDHALGDMMRAARDAPWFEDTAFVIFGDHPPHGVKGAGVNVRDLERRQHVPLLILAPGRIAPGVVDEVRSQLDLLPTLFDLVGLDEPFAAWGTSLLADPPGPGQAGAFVGDASFAGWIEDGLWLRHDRTVLLDASASDAARIEAIAEAMLEREAAAATAIRAGTWLPDPGASP